MSVQGYLCISQTLDASLFFIYDCFTQTHSHTHAYNGHPSLHSWSPFSALMANRFAHTHTHTGTRMPTHTHTHTHTHNPYQPFFLLLMLADWMFGKQAGTMPTYPYQLLNDSVCTTASGDNFFDVLPYQW